MAVRKTHHNAYSTHYHIVFPVKYQKALLRDEIPLAISTIAGEIALRYDIEFEQLGYDLNHIHILASFPPKYSGSEVVRIFKSITARELFKQFPQLRKELWGGEFWSDGLAIQQLAGFHDSKTPVLHLSPSASLRPCGENTIR